MIAIENQVAVVWDDYEIYIIKCNLNKNAYKLSWSDTGLNKEVLFKKILRYWDWDGTKNLKTSYNQVDLVIL